MDSVFDEGRARDPLAALVNAEIEQALLGSLFVDNRAYEHIADLIGPEDFGYGAHSRIFEAIAALASDGRPATPVTLKSMFEADGSLETLGGSQYLGKLAASAVSVVNCRHYAQQIVDLSTRRQIIAAAQEIIVGASIPDPERSADQVLDEAEERLSHIADQRGGEGAPRALRDIVQNTLTAIADAQRAGIAPALDLGLIDIDRIVAGMSPGDLVVLAARPSMGKSCLAATVAMNVARRGKRVLIYSLEMSREELTQRWIAGLTGISTDTQRRGEIEQNQWDDLVRAQRELDQLPILIDDQARLSVAQMRQRARRVRRRTGLDLIIVDHLQLIRQGGRQESRRLEIGDATSMLKAVAKELRVPVLLLSQLSRAPEQRDDKRPILSDLRESGDIEQDADVVMMLYREEYYLDRQEPKRRAGETNEAFNNRVADWEDRRSSMRGQAEIAVAKNRHGRTGIAKVYFDAERQRFESLERFR